MQSSYLGHAQFSISRNGSLAYIIGSAPEASSSLVWVDRDGEVQTLPSEPRAFMSPRLSPDGRRVAVTIRDANIDVWIYDLTRSLLSRFTTQVLEDENPTWSPDGDRLTIASTIAADRRVFRSVSVDGSGSEEQVMIDDQHSHIGGWSPDGRTLTYSRNDPLGTGLNIYAFMLDGQPDTLTVLQTAANEATPSFSPDGRWLAYMSDESGRPEIYVRPFPGPGGRERVSTAGGEEPVWAHNGELFYRNGEKMMAVDIVTEPSLTIGSPKLLFERRFVKIPWSRTNYDVTRDGQRFIMVADAQEPPEQINIVLNWFEELKRLVPTESD